MTSRKTIAKLFMEFLFKCTTVDLAGANPTNPYSCYLLDGESVSLRSEAVSINVSIRFRSASFSGPFSCISSY